MASRYVISPTDLKAAALTLNVGEGIAARLTTVDTTGFIEQGEEWAEDQVSDYLAVPLKPTPVRGATTVGSPLTKGNYPREFIMAAIYYAVSRMLHSEYFANEPNSSSSAEWAENTAYRHVMEFRSRPTVRVGGGRRRHPNPHMPPNIAPKEQPNQGQ